MEQVIADLEEQLRYALEAGDDERKYAEQLTKAIKLLKEHNKGEN